MKHSLQVAVGIFQLWASQQNCAYPSPHAVTVQTRQSEKDESKNIRNIVENQQLVTSSFQITVLKIL